MKTLAQKYPAAEILKIIDLISEAKDKINSSFIPQLPLEMAIVKTSQQENSRSFSETNSATANSSSVADRENPPQNKPSSLSTKPKLVKVKTKQSNKIKESKIRPTVSKNAGGVASDIKISLDNIKENWNNILIKVEPLNHSVSTILANCQPVKIKENIITIAAKYGFYKDRLNEDKNKTAIEKIINSILKSKATRIKVVTEEEAGIKIKAAAKKSEEKNGEQSNLLLSDAMKMMGGKVVE